MIQPFWWKQSCHFRRKTLRDCWELRNSIYEQHMDYLKWLKEIMELEGWLRQREDDVFSTEYGNSFDELDKLMLKQVLKHL